MSETENHLITAKDLKYISSVLCQQRRDLVAETHRLLNGDIDYLKRQKSGRDEPSHGINAESFAADQGAT